MYVWNRRSRGLVRINVAHATPRRLGTRHVRSGYIVCPDFLIVPSGGLRAAFVAPFDLAFLDWSVSVL
jgi:hypothetical protein